MKIISSEEYSKLRLKQHYHRSSNYFIVEAMEKMLVGDRFHINRDEYTGKNFSSYIYSQNQKMGKSFRCQELQDETGFVVTRVK